MFHLQIFVHENYTFIVHDLFHLYMQRKHTTPGDARIATSLYIHGILQRPLLRRLLVRLDLVSNVEIFPVLERDTALGILAHGLDVLLLVLDVVDYTCD